MTILTKEYLEDCNRRSMAALQTLCRAAEAEKCWRILDAVDPNALGDLIEDRPKNETLVRI